MYVHKTIKISTRAKEMKETSILIDQLLRLEHNDVHILSFYLFLDQFVHKNKIKTAVKAEKDLGKAGNETSDEINETFGDRNDTPVAQNRVVVLFNATN